MADRLELDVDETEEPAGELGFIRTRVWRRGFWTPNPWLCLGSLCIVLGAVIAYGTLFTPDGTLKTAAYSIAGIGVGLVNVAIGYLKEVSHV